RGPGRARPLQKPVRRAKQTGGSLELLGTGRQAGQTGQAIGDAPPIPDSLKRRQALLEERLGPHGVSFVLRHVGQVVEHAGHAIGASSLPEERQAFPIPSDSLLIVSRRPLDVAQPVEQLGAAPPITYPPPNLQALLEALPGCQKVT